MKKFLISLFVLTILLSTFSIAQEEELTAGTLPDSPLYNLDLVFERLSLFFTPNQYDKIIKKIEFADERISEYKLMVDKNKPDYANVAKSNHVNLLDEIEKDKTNLTEKQNVDLSVRLQKHILVLERVREKVPESAKAGLTNAIEKSSKVITKTQERLSEDNKYSVSELRDIANNSKVV